LDEPQSIVEDRTYELEDVKSTLVDYQKTAVKAKEKLLEALRSLKDEILVKGNEKPVLGKRKRSE